MVDEKIVDKIVSAAQEAEAHVIEIFDMVAKVKESIPTIIIAISEVKDGEKRRRAYDAIAVIVKNIEKIEEKAKEIHNSCKIIIGIDTEDDDFIEEFPEE